FTLGQDRQLVVALIPAAVHRREAEEMVSASAGALDGKWKLPSNQAQLIVNLMQPAGPRIETLTRFTAVLAALVQVTRPVGIYWGEAMATHEPKFFLEKARAPG